MPRQYSISDMQTLAQQKGGKCLSAEYITQKTKLEWKCEKGHRWWAAPDGICNNHTWCPKCANNVPHTLQEMQELAISRGGKCLSNEYSSLKIPLLWECEKGHRWSAKPGNVLSKTWCPQCANALPHTLQEMQELAVSRGGKCLSNEYRGLRTPLLWECEKGHRWSVAPETIYRNNTWCPECAHHLPHSIQEMQKLAESRNGRCISTEYINQKTKLEWECAKGHRWYSASNHIMEGHWCPKCAFEELGKVKRLDCDFVNKKIEAMGGKWISGEYRNSSSKLLIECKNGHVWTAYFKHIRYGHWCPTCAGKKSYTIDDMNKLAAEKGGKCLSKEYTNHDAKLRWQCKNGHEWESTPHNVIFKHWCPICLHPNAKYSHKNKH